MVGNVGQRQRNHAATGGKWRNQGKRSQRTAGDELGAVFRVQRAAETKRRDRHEEIWKDFHGIAKV